MSCDGIYADIERVEEDVIAAPSGGQVEEMGALQLLVKEYEEYKKKYTESLMFNATASSSNYGGFGIASFFCLIRFFVSCRATLLIAPADPDFL